MFFVSFLQLISYLVISGTNYFPQESFQFPKCLFSYLFSQPSILQNISFCHSTSPFRVRLMKQKIPHTCFLPLDVDSISENTVAANLILHSLNSVYPQILVRCMHTYGMLAKVVCMFLPPDVDFISENPVAAYLILHSLNNLYPQILVCCMRTYRIKVAYYHVNRTE